MKLFSLKAVCDSIGCFSHLVCELQMYALWSTLCCTYKSANVPTLA